MSDRHDLRRQIREIQDSLGRFEREQLVDILTHIFRLYVMEGGALQPQGAVALGDELAGLSFAQLIERLQLRLDLPELQLFEVQGGRVSVKIDGRPQPIELPVARTEPPPPARPAAAAPAVAASVAPAPAAAAVAAPPAATPAVSASDSRAGAPPPGVVPAGYAGGNRLETNLRPTAPRGPTPGASASSKAAPAPAPAPAAAAPAKPEPRPEESAPGGRFGLLEID